MEYVISRSFSQVSQTTSYPLLLMYTHLPAACSFCMWCCVLVIPGAGSRRRCSAAAASL